MKLTKSTALLAIAALAMSSAQAMAATFVATGSNPHNAPGHLTAGGGGKNYDCRIDTFQFTVTSADMTSLSGSVLTNDHGGLPTYQPCNSTSGTLDTFYVTPDSTSQINVAVINFNAPFGLCTEYDVKLNWTNGGAGSADSTVTGTGIPIGFLCTLNSLTLTATGVKIAP